MPTAVKDLYSSLGTLFECPHCGKDFTDIVISDILPETGEFAICLFCFEVSRFNKNLKLVSLSIKDQMKIDTCDEVKILKKELKKATRNFFNHQKLAS